MKRFTLIALVALALAAVPVALGDNGNNPPPTGTTTTTSSGQTQHAGNGGGRFQKLRQHLKVAGHRFANQCGSGANGASQTCVDFANKVEQGLEKLDTNIQARIAKIQQTCSSSGTSSTTTTTTTPTTSSPTHDRCAGASKRIALLQKIDTRVQALVVKVQAWLAGTSSTTGSSSTSDSTLDQAAAGLNQLGRQAGAGR
jgi:hypothetical protein